MIVFAIKNGNWSDPTIWTSQKIPTTENIVYSAGKEIILDVDCAANILTTDGPYEGLYGGCFILENNVTFTGNIKSNSTTCIKYFGNNSTIVGTITGGNNGYITAVENLSSGCLNIIGEVRGGEGGYSYGINNCSTGTINLTGLSLLGLGGFSWGIWNSQNGKINLNGVENNRQGEYLT